MRKRLIHIHSCRGITRRTIQYLLHHDPTLKQIYSYSSDKLSQFFKIPMKNASIFYKDLHNIKLKRKTFYEISNYNIVTIVDENYPDMLKRIKDPPLVLYLKGNCSLLNLSPKLSIIGTRNPTSEAVRKTDLFVKPLVDRKWIIVSGMAKGIDSYAHHLTLKHGGKTIAVLGGGFNYIYPKQNISLYENIKDNGLIITDYAPDRPPMKYHFPERNQIISGLSFGTLVIEATERSCTLITVDQALDQGREVYAVPGSTLISQTKGCHEMIQDGAKLVIDAKDIIEDWEGIGLHLFNS